MRLPTSFPRVAVLMTALVAAGCGNGCETGYAKANDGTCYPIDDGEGRGDDDDDGPAGRDTSVYGTLRAGDDTGRRSARGRSARTQGPATVDVSLGCPMSCGVGRLELSVEASVARGSYAIVDVARTDGGDDAAMPIYEAHILLPSRQAADATTFTAQPLAGLGFVDGVASELSCDDVRGRDGLSWMVRVYDRHGRLWDCRADGHDPEALVGRSVPSFGNRLQREDISSATCSVVARR